MRRCSTMSIFAPARQWVASAVFLLSSFAPNDEVPVRIRYQAPEGCPKADAFYAALRARTERVRIAVAGEDARDFDVRIVRDQAGAVGDLRVRGEKGTTQTRRVEGSSCEEVVQAVALTAALSVDPAASLAPAVPSAAPSPPAPAGSAANPRASASAALLPASPIAVAPSPSSRQWIIEIGAEGLVAHQLIPSVSAGGAFSASMARVAAGAWSPSIELSLGYLRNDLFARPADAAAQLSVATLTVCPLRLSFLRQVETRLCALGQGGRLAARGLRVDQPESAARPWWAAGLGGQVRVGLFSKLVLKLDAALVLPLPRHGFVIEDPSRFAGETPVFSPVAGLGIAIRL
jgi:hypothetical protein